MLQYVLCLFPFADNITVAATTTTIHIPDQTHFPKIKVMVDSHMLPLNCTIQTMPVSSCIEALLVQFYYLL